MFTEQIKAPKVRGIVHVCDAKIYMDEFHRIRTKDCAVCGKSKYGGIHPMENIYSLLQNDQAQQTSGLLEEDRYRLPQSSDECIIYKEFEPKPVRWFKAIKKFLRVKDE